MRWIMQFRQRGLTCFLAAVAWAFFSMTVGANEPVQPAAEFLNETVIIERVERLPDTTKLSPGALEHLNAANDVLREFFQRLGPANSKPALELLSDSYRANYESSQQFYQEQFESERIVSYRIIDFRIDPPQTNIWFRFLLTETLEGIDYITPRSVKLQRTQEAWRIENLE